MRAFFHGLVLLVVALTGCVSSRIDGTQPREHFGLSLTVHPPTTSFRFAEPIVLHASLHNFSSNKVEALPFAPVSSARIIFSGFDRSIQRSQTLFHVNRVAGVGADDLPDLLEPLDIELPSTPLSLAPGQTIVIPFDLKSTPEAAFAIDGPGEFLLRVEYEAEGGLWQGRVRSNTVRIKVE